MFSKISEKIFGPKKEEKEEFKIPKLPKVECGEGEKKRLNQVLHQSDGNYALVLISELNLASVDFKDDKLYLAYFRIERCRLWILHKAEPKGTKAWEETVVNTQTYKTIMKWRDLCDAYLKTIESDENWNLYSKDDKISSWWREEEDAETCSFRVSGIVKSNILKVIPLLLETDLYPQWFPLMKKARELLSPSRYHKIIKTEMSMPYPLLVRECIIDGRGWDVMEHNRVLVSSRSIFHHPDIEIGPCPKDRVRVDIKLGGFSLVPIDEKQTYVTVMMNLNPHIPMLPTSIMNFFLRKVVNQIHYAMEKHSQMKTGSPYPKRMREKATRNS
ncbi:hypothetical protein AAMO2058_000289100 [Amorphochlora amoebiformis]